MVDKLLANVLASEVVVHNNIFHPGFCSCRYYIRGKSGHAHHLVANVGKEQVGAVRLNYGCLLYTSDAADE